MVTVRLIRSNEIYDIFFVIGKGHYEYVRYPRSSHMTVAELTTYYSES